MKKKCDSYATMSLFMFLIFHCKGKNLGSYSNIWSFFQIKNFYLSPFIPVIPNFYFWMTQIISSREFLQMFYHRNINFFYGFIIGWNYGFMKLWRSPGTPLKDPTV